MKIVFLTAAVLSLCIGPGCGGGTNKPNAVNTPLRAQPTPIPTASIPKDGNYNGRGKVTKIDLANGSVEIDHEEIPDMMPRMIMEFSVKNKAELKPLKVGDQVDFVLEYKHPTEVIVSIKKAQ